MTDALDMLADIPGLAAEVEATRDHPNPSGRTDRKQRTVPGPKPPTNLAMLHATMPAEAGGLRAELVTSVRLVVDEMADADMTEQIPDWPDDTWAGLCQWLAETYTWWDAQPWAEEVRGVPATKKAPATGILAVWGTLRELARIPRPVVLACLTEGCHGSIRPMHDDGVDRIWPDLCENGHRVDRHAMAERARQAIPMTLGQIASEVKRPYKTVESWVTRGLLQPISTRKPKRYNLGDAQWLNAHNPTRKAG